MKRFLLLNSPIFWEAIEEKEEYLSPLGLGYIATYLSRAGIDVTLVDCVKERLGVEDVIALVGDENPDYMGINVFTQNYHIVKYIAERIDIKCEIFVGGQVIKSLYRSILSWDIKNRVNIIIGEGELIIPDIALEKCLEEPISCDHLKRVYKVDKDSQYYPGNISEISLDRRHFKDEIIVNHYGQKEVGIVTSRGCSYDCAFCGGAKSLNRDVTIRTRTAESVINEIRTLVTRYSELESIRILDDLFLRNEKSIIAANRIFSNFPQLSWRGMLHTLSLIKSIDRIADLTKSNCRELFLGIESGSDLIREKINKCGTIDDIIAVTTKLLSAGIDVKGYFIFGFPGETKKDFDDTYDLAYKLAERSKKQPGVFRTSVFQFRPYHGTLLYENIVAEYGEISDCEMNPSINQFQGRTQFNFQSGNYSLESNELLNEYIIKTQKLTEKNEGSD